MIRTIALVFVALFLIKASEAFAHGDLHERIANITQEIKRSTDPVDLYVRRAELHSQHRDWTAARGDFVRARSFTPPSKLLDFYEGRMEYKARRPAVAITLLDRQLRAIPDHLSARLFRARSEVQAGRLGDAIRDYDEILDRMENPSPDFYIERARAQVANKVDVTKILNGIDRGSARLEPVVTLQIFALELEMQHQRWAAALRRIDRTLPTLPLQSPWLLHRGEVLVQLGRTEEARTAYSRALQQIEAIPASRRQSRMFRSLTEKAHVALAQLSGEQPKSGTRFDEEQDQDSL